MLNGQYLHSHIGYSNRESDHTIERGKIKDFFGKCQTKKGNENQAKPNQSYERVCEREKKANPMKVKPAQTSIRAKPKLNKCV